MTKIIWTSTALERVDEIVQYIADDNPNAALKWLDALFKKVDLIPSHPLSYRIAPEINNKLIREIVFRNYRVIFKVEKTVVTIMTVRHFKQILPVSDFS